MQSLSFFRASRSASSSDTGSANAQTFNSHTNEEKQPQSSSFGPTWSEVVSQTSAVVASQMPEVKRMVVLTATKKLLTQSFFNISDLRGIATVVGVPTNGGAWTMLQTLHCVDYAAMPPMLREAIPHLVNECLTARQAFVIDVQTALKGVDL
jgi:hypothetical protein